MVDKILFFRLEAIINSKAIINAKRKEITINDNF